MTNEDWLIADGKAIIVEGNQIAEIVDSKTALDDYSSHVDHSETSLVDANGKAIIPGLIDSHTHIVWGGDRSREVRLKLQGKSYSDIAAMGGGINSTVSMTRMLTQEQLFHSAKRRALTALSNGTTFIETKSGYGLSTESELKLLSVAKLLDQDQHANCPIIKTSFDVSNHDATELSDIVESVLLKNLSSSNTTGA
ncbi:MAG: hypothetical protein VYC12_04415, partial [Candidatus Thermoplasmatota archaeon]|nr:hypothetical protein [Candidatus Thermoplasmatota archaeon]